MNGFDRTDDAALAVLARDGSSEAFGALVHRYHGRVFAFLITLTRHRQDAEDLTQETFLRAWDKFGRYDPERPLLPWLLTLARRQSLTALRRIRRVPEEIIAPTAPEPENLSLRLWNLAKSQLTPTAYSALWLHYREELPLKEVAAIIGKREGAVKVILHRARQTLDASVHGQQCAQYPDRLPEPQRSML